MMKNAFYIILVALSIPKIFKFLVRFCGHVGEKLGSKFITSQPGLKTIFRLEVASKKPLFPKFDFYGDKNLNPTPGSYTKKMLFANASKIIRN